MNAVWSGTLGILASDDLDRADTAILAVQKSGILSIAFFTSQQESHLYNMNNNFDAWFPVRQILCRQYISNKITNVASYQNKRSIEVRSSDTRLVIYEDNVPGDEECERLEWSCWSPRVGALGTQDLHEYKKVPTDLFSISVSM